MQFPRELSLFNTNLSPKLPKRWLLKLWWVVLPVPPAVVAVLWPPFRMLPLPLDTAVRGLEVSARVDVVSEIGPPTSMGESAVTDGDGLSSAWWEYLKIEKLSKNCLWILKSRQRTAKLTSTRVTAFRRCSNQTECSSSGASGCCRSEAGPVRSPSEDSSVGHLSYACRHRRRPR